MYRVKNIMTDRLVAIRPETTIDEAISLILDHDVSGMPVVDGDGQLIGMISEIDIIKLVYEVDIEATTVGDHMTHSVRALDADASLDDAARLFSEEPIRRFPVVREGRLVGILSRRDLIRFVRDIRKQAAAQQLKHQEST